MKRIKANHRQPIVLWLGILIFLFSNSCTSVATYSYKYSPPAEINDGLAVGSLIDVGIDTALMNKGLMDIKNGRYKEIHSILIYKDKKLVLEEYFSGHQFNWEAPGHHGNWINWDRDSLHRIHSCTKSVTSACIGIAIEKGIINNVDQSIFDYLPNHQHLKTEKNEKITIEHLLTMTSGIDANEWTSAYSNPGNPVISIWYCDDPITCILEFEIDAEHGKKYSYYGGSQIVLGEIVKNASGMDINDFSKKYLFDPLAIDTFNWVLQFDNGVYEAAGGLKLKPRGMLKFGLLFLNNGIWNDSTIVSKSWVVTSATAFGNNTGINIPGVDSGRKNGYSYSWWTHEFEHEGQKIHAYNAGGWGGQNIFVISELNTVVVFTGGTYTSKIKEFKIMNKFVIPALI